MADRAVTILKAKNGLHHRYEFGETIVTLNDTITLSNFTNASNLLNIYLMKKSDGTEMTNTHAALNVVTITGAGTDVACIYMAYGLRVQ